ncbi:hypothetical protein VNO77_21141 [Canavalia gladiata]|uniref:Uncharacterized protein n=1 Tax=Canavalia gladiata TaxID=3824 RepID=A0AAN9LQU2_CANGL
MLHTGVDDDDGCFRERRGSSPVCELETYLGGERERERVESEPSLTALRVQDRNSATVLRHHIILPQLHP